MANSIWGWYPDPWQQAEYRFWDGQAWTGYVSAPAWTPAPVWTPATVLVTPEPVWAEQLAPVGAAANRAPLVWWLAAGSVAAVFVISIALAWIISR